VRMQTVMVDVVRCTGCGACVAACPIGAIALVDGKARVDEDTCTGCEACLDVCPVGALQPIIQGELVSVPRRAATVAYQPSPLAETAGAAVAVARLLARAVHALARMIGRWPARRSEGIAPAAGVASWTGSWAKRRYRARHRRRGQ